MKLKVVIVDLEIPPRVRKWGLRIGLPLAALIVGGVAYADLPVPPWTDGQTLKAPDLNANFQYLQSEIAGDGGPLQGGTKNFVDLATAQTVGGTKTFTGDIVVTGPANGGIGEILLGGPDNNSAIGSNNAGYELDLVGGVPNGVGGIVSGQNMGGHIFLGGPARGDGFINGIVFAQNGVERMRVNNGGNVGIGTTNPAATFQVVGTAFGAWSGPSDERLKANIRTLEHPLDDLAQLRGVRFTWKQDGKPSLGVIAQEVELVYPELVSTGSDGMKAVEYDKLVAVLIESSKALAAQNVGLKHENDELRERMDRIEQRVVRLAAK